MKKYIALLVSFLILLSGVFLWFQHQDNRLFYFQGKYYTCDEPTEFWVGLPENCTLCPNRYAQYYGDDLFPIWACLPYVPEEEVVPNLPEPDFQPKSTCPKERPLRDILGHCYPCNTHQPVRLLNNNDTTCSGKRYLTEHRLSEKSRKCPAKKDITDPEVCQDCHGFWYDESCHLFKGKESRYCQTNQECSPNEYCYPFRYQHQNQTGICRPLSQKRWICSATDGYNNASAHLFCERQNAHIPDLNTFQAQKEEALSACPDTDVWVFFDEGSLYLKSLSMEFLFTREGMSKDYGGDKFYALCQSN